MLPRWPNNSINNYLVRVFDHQCKKLMSLLTRIPVVLAGGLLFMSNYYTRVLALLIFLLQNYSLSPKRANNCSANLLHALQISSLHHSWFRLAPDTTLAGHLGEALLEIGYRVWAGSERPTKKIRQTGPDDAAERDQDWKLWEKHNRGLKSAMYHWRGVMLFQP
jgi:hypothetical protein